MDDLSPGARSLLQAADTYDDPSADDAARVRRAVMTRVGAIGLTAAVVTAGSTQAKAASVISIAAKLTAALAITAGGVAATWTYVSHNREVAVTVLHLKRETRKQGHALVTTAHDHLHQCRLG